MPMLMDRHEAQMALARVKQHLLAAYRDVGVPATLTPKGSTIQLRADVAEHAVLHALHVVEEALQASTTPGADEPPAETET